MKEQLQGSVGDIVAIYQRPLTQQEYEGQAILRRFIGDKEIWNGQIVERWKVQFVGDDAKSQYERLIYFPSTNQEPQP